MVKSVLTNQRKTTYLLISYNNIDFFKNLLLLFFGDFSTVFLLLLNLMVLYNFILNINGLISYEHITI